MGISEFDAGCIDLRLKEDHIWTGRNSPAIVTGRKHAISRFQYRLDRHLLLEQTHTNRDSKLHFGPHKKSANPEVYSSLRSHC